MIATTAHPRTTNDSTHGIFLNLSQADTKLNGTTLGWNILSASVVANRIGYAGYQKDINLDISHVRNRVLEPHLGRWTRRDPLGYVDGMGLYEYVSSRALMLADPFGAAQWFNGTSIRDQCDPLLGCEHLMACADCDSRDPNDPPAPLIHAGGAQDSQNYAEIRCRQLDNTIFIPQHCYIRCCKGGQNGTCHTYSLLNRGTACIEQDAPDELRHGRPKGTRHRSISGTNLCACFERAFTENHGGECPYKYFPNNCNSNWYTNSMWACCTGKKAAAPITAPFGMWWDCYPCGREFEDWRRTGEGCPFKCDFSFGPNNDQTPPGRDYAYCRACAQ